MINIILVIALLMAIIAIILIDNKIRDLKNKIDDLKEGNDMIAKALDNLDILYGTIYREYSELDAREQKHYDFLTIREG